MVAVGRERPVVLWYMMKDVYSRKLVAREVHESESAELAARLLTQGCLREGVRGQPLVLHSDNGSAMKGATMLACCRSPTNPQKIGPTSALTASPAMASK